MASWCNMKRKRHLARQPSTDEWKPLTQGFMSQFTLVSLRIQLYQERRPENPRLHQGVYQLFESSWLHQKSDTHGPWLHSLKLSSGDGVTNSAAAAVDGQRRSIGHVECVCCHLANVNSLLGRQVNRACSSVKLWRQRITLGHGACWRFTPLYHHSFQARTQPFWWRWLYLSKKRTCLDIPIRVLCCQGHQGACSPDKYLHYELQKSTCSALYIGIDFERKKLQFFFAKYGPPLLQAWFGHMFTREFASLGTYLLKT